MSYIQLKRGTGIDGIVRDYAPDTPSETRGLEVLNLSSSSRLFKKYKSALHYGSHVGLSASITEKLTPEQVNLFLQSTIGFEEERNYAQITAIFLNQLIINSYIAHGNNFVLVSPNQIALSGFGQELGYVKKGFFPNYEISPLTKERPLILEIRGSLEKHQFHRLKYTSLTVYGDVGILFGTISEDSDITVNGEATYGFCDQARRCTITVDKLHENISHNNGREATQCTFRTSNSNTLETIMQSVPKDNRIVFLEADGTERIVRDFSG